MRRETRGSGSVLGVNDLVLSLLVELATIESTGKRIRGIEISVFVDIFEEGSASRERLIRVKLLRVRGEEGRFFDMRRRSSEPFFGEAGGVGLHLSQSSFAFFGREGAGWNLGGLSLEMRRGIGRMRRICGRGRSRSWRRGCC